MAIQVALETAQESVAGVPWITTFVLALNETMVGSGLLM